MDITAPTCGMWGAVLPDAGRGKLRREGAGFGSIFSSGLSLLTDIAHSEQSGAEEWLEDKLQQEGWSSRHC